MGEEASWEEYSVQTMYSILLVAGGIIFSTLAWKRSRKRYGVAHDVQEAVKTPQAPDDFDDVGETVEGAPAAEHRPTA